MIHNIETIPAKLYFKIVETNNLALLSDEILENNILLSAWGEIEDEHSKLAPNKELNRVVDISKNIESISAKHKSIINAIYCLRIQKDAELIELLKSYGFTFSSDFNKDLDKFERESKSFQLQIKRLQQGLPEPKEQNTSNFSFEEVVMSYCVITGLSYKPSEILLIEYYPLINVGNQKLKALENGRKG